MGFLDSLFGTNKNGLGTPVAGSNVDRQPDLTSVVKPQALPATPQPSATGTQLYGGGGEENNATGKQIFGGGGEENNATGKQIFGGGGEENNATGKKIFGGDANASEVIGPPKNVPPPVGVADFAKEVRPPASAQKAGASFQAEIEDKITGNALNDYWQPTYHFKLFMAGDKDLLSALGNPNTMSEVMSRLNGGNISQVIIAESGVTGYTIKNVEIESVSSQTGRTRDQKAATVTMTIVEPLGISFLDAMAGAATMLGVFNYTKMIFFLELSFKGYPADGTPSGKPLPIPMSNGGKWLWALTLTKVDTKLNEGGGVYTLLFVNNEAEAVILEQKALSAKQQIIVEGNTVGEMLNDYAEKLTKAWITDQGKDQFGKGQVTFNIKADRPVKYGPYTGKIPADFKIAPVLRELSPNKTLKLNDKGKYTLTASPGISVNEFITSVIKSTEEGKALIKDVPIVQQDALAPKKYRQSILFSIEADVRPDKKILDTNTYQKTVTLTVVPTYSQTASLDASDVKNDADAGVQQQRVRNLSIQGFLRKRYDYIFTGLNTEITDFNIEFNLAWQAELPKQSGNHLNFLKKAMHARSNDHVDVTADMATSESFNNGTGGTLYMEDILSRLNQGNFVALPQSFDTGYQDAAREANNGSSDQWSRDQSLVAAVFTQKYYGQFMNIELHIRGDPYWIGQTNIERQILLRSNKDVHDADALPDYSTGNPVFLLHFRYPSQIGDDFVPVLQTSAVFDGVYEVNTARHMFSDGTFKQVLLATRMVQIDLALAYGANPDKSLINDRTSSGTPTAGTAPSSQSSSNTKPPLTLDPTASVGKGGQYASLFTATEQKYDLPPGTLAGIGNIETGGTYDPTLVNKNSGAAGLMGILASTASQPGFGVTPITADDRKDPATSIDFAGQYLAALAKRDGLSSAIHTYSGGGYQLAPST